MRCIADALGVPITRVSRALGNHQDIAKETREEILDKVKESHYSPK